MQQLDLGRAEGAEVLDAERIDVHGPMGVHSSVARKRCQPVLSPSKTWS
jgi:hypothetical protein